MKFVIAAVTAAFLLGGPIVAQAATETVVETLDLSQAKFAATGFTGVQDFGPFSPAFSFDLTAGDTFDYTILFKPGQTLTLVDPSLIWAFTYATDGQSTNFNSTGVLSLLDSTGAAFLTSTVKTDDEGDYHVGQQFAPSDFTGGLPSTLTFSGLHYVGTLNSYDDPTVTTRAYGDPALYLDAGGISTNVPEPATWALMLCGVAMLGLAMRRAKPAAVLAA
jgi:hypothetical protein